MQLLQQQQQQQQQQRSTGIAAKYRFHFIIFLLNSTCTNPYSNQASSDCMSSPWFVDPP